MTDPGTQPTSRSDSMAISRSLYWFVIVLAAIALAITIFAMRNSAAGGHGRPFAWLTPTGVLCFGVGGILGRRSPGLQRVLTGLGLILVIAGLVETIRH